MARTIKKTAHSPHKPATGSEIRDILKRDDPELITSLMRTGASRNEIMQACEWLDDDDYMGGDLEKNIPARTRHAYTLLREIEEGDGEEGR